MLLSNRVVRQYRACVVDLLGLGIHMCGVHYSIIGVHYSIIDFYIISHQSSMYMQRGWRVVLLSNRVVRQYRACVVDLLGLGIHMCGVHYSIMRTTHPDLVCLLFVPSLYSTF